MTEAGGARAVGRRHGRGLARGLVLVLALGGAAAAWTAGAARAAAPGAPPAPAHAPAAAPGAPPAPAPSHAPALVLVSRPLKAYVAAAEAALAALRAAGGPGGRRVDLGGAVDAGVAALRALPPGGASALLVFGPEAARASAAVAHGLPIVYAQVLDPAGTGVLAHALAWGVSTEVPPEVVLDRVKLHLPDVRRIGAAHDPARGGAYVAAAMAAAKTRGLVVTPIAAHAPRDVPDAWRAARAHIDALWLPPVPDPTVLEPSALAFLLDGALHDRRPVVTHYPTLRAKGPVLSVETAPEATGKQAATLLRRLLAGERPEPRLSAPDGLVVCVRKSLADRLGVRVAAGAGATMECAP